MNVLQASSEDRRTPLTFAVETRNVDMVKVLIKHKASTNMADGVARTPLEMVAGGDGSSRSTNNTSPTPPKAQSLLLGTSFKPSCIMQAVLRVSNHRVEAIMTPILIAVAILPSSRRLLILFIQGHPTPCDNEKGRDGLLPTAAKHHENGGNNGNTATNVDGERVIRYA